MSAVDKLKSRYGTFFVGCAAVGFSPYLATYKFFSGNNNENAGVGVAACLALTFIVPVLPFLTSFTLKVAAIVAVLALASLLITYPSALISDGCNNLSSSFRT